MCSCRYERLENWHAAAEQAYLLAQVHHALGQEKQRDRAADCWQQLTEQAALAVGQVA